MTKLKRKVYQVHLPYPKNAKIRMVSYLKNQPYFFCKDVAKCFDMTTKKAMSLAMPHVGKVLSIPLVSLYGYWKIALLGQTPKNHILQQSFLKMSLNTLYKDNILKYLKIVQKHAKGKAK